MLMQPSPTIWTIPVAPVMPDTSRSIGSAFSEQTEDSSATGNLKEATPRRRGELTVCVEALKCEVFLVPLAGTTHPRCVSNLSLKSCAEWSGCSDVPIWFRLVRVGKDGYGRSHS